MQFCDGPKNIELRGINVMDDICMHIRYKNANCDREGLIVNI